MRSAQWTSQGQRVPLVVCRTERRRAWTYMASSAGWSPSLRKAVTISNGRGLCTDQVASWGRAGSSLVTSRGVVLGGAGVESVEDGVAVLDETAEASISGGALLGLFVVGDAEEMGDGGAVGSLAKPDDAQAWQVAGLAWGGAGFGLI